MPKHPIKSSYTAEGAKGILKERGSKRQKAVEQAAQSVGGKVEALYFAFGDTDNYVIVDLPDRLSAVTASLMVNASELICPQELVQVA